MRTMYDAVTAANIPRDARMVAGYIDKIRLEPWSAADWARFPNAVRVTIVKKASTNAGHVLDVEPGDATPAEAPGWVRMRRAAGADPTVYMNLSTWPTVRAEFDRQGVAQPHYWVARYDGNPEWGAGWAALGCVAKQYAGDVPPGIDLSSVADFWPGVDGEEDMTPQEFLDTKVTWWDGHTVPMKDLLAEVYIAARGLGGKPAFADQKAPVLLPPLVGLGGKVDAVNAAVAALAAEPDVTEDKLREIINAAVASNIAITGNVHIGPATAEPGAVQ